MEVQAVRDILAASMVGEAQVLGSAIGSSGSGARTTTVFTDINQMIYNKEKELKEFQEMKCSNLEKLVIERDTLLIESSKRFEQMKKDFKYNLTLLEVRDKEIERLEKLVEEKGALLLANELDRKCLYDKIVVLENKEDKLSERHEREKGHYRRVLEEMKEAIEGMKWAALEDGRAKAKEVEALKTDLSCLMLSRDESLDSQRKDLTQTFEQLLVQREQSCTAKERELAGQLAAVAAKHDKLQKEAGHIKSELLDSCRQREGLAEELSRKEESYRQLQWRVDDERAARQEREDELQREAQQLSIELSNLKEKLLNDVNDYKRRLDAATSDAAREREFRIAADARHEGSKQQLSADLRRLATELAAVQEREAGFECALASIRCERDAAEERSAALRGEAEALAVARRSLEREVASAQAASRGLAEQLAQERASMGALREYAEQLKEELRHAARSTDEHAAKQSREETLLMEMRYESEKTINRLENSVRLLEVERDRLEVGGRMVGALLEEERAEAAAVALRLRLSEGQLVSLQQQLSQLSREAVEEASEQRAADRPVAVAARPARVAGLSSPVFSEDFGPASLPASPVATQSPRHRYGRQELSPADNILNSSAYSDSTNNDTTLVAENERLRAVIKDMRLHVDDLHHSQDIIGAAAALKEKDAKIAAQGERLQVMAAEVQRLRSERRRLMDVGNELRAALRSRDEVGDVARGASADHEDKYSNQVRRPVVAWTDGDYDRTDRHALQAVQAGRADVYPLAITMANPPLAVPRPSAQEGIRVEGQPVRAGPPAPENAAAPGASSATSAVVGGSGRGSGGARQQQRRDKILLADSLRRRNYGLAAGADR